MRKDNKYWLMAYVVPASDFPAWLFNNSEWVVYDSFNKNLTEGDILFLANSEIGIYAWGYLIEKGHPDSNEQNFIKISRGAIKVNLIEKSHTQQIKDIADLFSFHGGRFTFLTNRQVKIINSLMSHEVSKPPLPRNQQFIIYQPVEEDEGLHTEFKEININKIPDAAYDYAQSFLNQDGGRIYFGIRDKDKTVVGINVEYSKRDEIQQKVESKLYSIEPRVYAVEHYSMEFHLVIDSNGNQIQDCYVFELEIKPTTSKNFKSAGGKHSIKTFSGKRRIE